MAQRRMLSKKITDTDDFLNMPLTAQALYFHLNLHADDDGFIGNAKTILRMVNSNEDDLKLLITKQFVIVFGSGVIVIKDWKIHNYIRKDTYNETLYSEEKSMLSTDEHGSYVNGQRPVDEPLTQVRLGKDRLGKGSCSSSTKLDNNKNIDSGTTENSQQLATATTDKNINNIPNDQKSINVYQNNIGVLNPMLIENIDYWIDDFTEQGCTDLEANQIVNKAISVAVDNNARNWSYINSILKRYHENNLYSLEDITASEQEYKNKQQGNQGGKDYETTEMPF